MAIGKAPAAKPLLTLTMLDPPTVTPVGSEPTSHMSLAGRHQPPPSLPLPAWIWAVVEPLLPDRLNNPGLPADSVKKIVLDVPSVTFWILIVPLIVARSPPPA